MKGKRREDKTLPYDLEPGEYSKAAEDGSAWWVCCPNGDYGRIEQPKWVIAEHDDGTITVSPSIKVAPYPTESGMTSGWHGFLERGVWREV